MDDEFEDTTNALMEQKVFSSSSGSSAYGKRPVVTQEAQALSETQETPVAQHAHVVQQVQQTPAVPEEPDEQAQNNVILEQIDAHDYPISAAWIAKKTAQRKSDINKQLYAMKRAGLVAQLDMSPPLWRRV